MKEYSICGIDFENGSLKTMEGKKFLIDAWDISIMAGWCPSEKIVLTEKNGRKVLKHISGNIVRIR